MRLDALQIEEIFYTLCNGSVHTYEKELAEGYLTTAVGNRVGVAGQFVQREGQCIALQKVTSLNLRIARSCNIHLPLEQDHLPGCRRFCHCMQRQQHEVYVQALFGDDHQLR